VPSSESPSQWTIRRPLATDSQTGSRSVSQ
jgi:hypothetical protein